MSNDRQHDSLTPIFVALILAIPVVALTVTGAYSLAGLVALVAWWLLRKPSRFKSAWWFYAGMFVLAAYFMLTLAEVIKLPGLISEAPLIAGVILSSADKKFRKRRQTTDPDLEKTELARRASLEESLRMRLGRPSETVTQDSVRQPEFEL